MLTSPLFNVQPDWKPPSQLPDFTGASVISLDLETSDPQLKTKGPGAARGDGKILGVSLGTDIHPAVYVPLQHASGNYHCEKTAWRWVQHWLKTSQPKLGANIFYDLAWLRYQGIEVLGPKHDIQIAEPLLDENKRSYSLEAIAQSYLGVGKDTSALSKYAEDHGLKYENLMSMLADLPAHLVGPYAEQDVNLLWPIFKMQQAKLLEPDSRGRTLQASFDLETELVEVLLDVHFQGVLIDVDRAEATRLEFLVKETEALRSLQLQTGADVEIWAAASLSKAYDKAGIAYLRTAKGAPSFTQDWLDQQKDPLSCEIVKARKYNKARSTFVENSVLEKISSSNRIHPQFLQVRGELGGTRSYRFSSINPNLQQVPARDPEIGSALRSLFLPEPGKKWLSADYSAQEIRIANHLAISTKAPGHEKLQQAYVDNPRVDFHQTVADWTGLPRKQAKILNLSIQYGAGRKKIAGMLGVTETEAKSILDTYHSYLPFVRFLTTALSERANAEGYVVEHGGRRCRFDTWEKDVAWNMRDWEAKPLTLDEAKKAWPGAYIKRAFTYKALNRWVQSSAATQTKRAMLLCWKHGHVCHLTVHDELTFSVCSAEEARRIGQLMVQAETFAVPSVVDLEWGPSWGKLEDVA